MWASLVLSSAYGSLKCCVQILSTPNNDTFVSVTSIVGLQIPRLLYIISKTDSSIEKISNVGHLPG